MSINWKKIGVASVVIIIVSIFISNLYVVYSANQNDSGYVTVGVPASPGINGDDGKNGANGRDGANGSSGQNGSNGSNGQNGSNGADGTNGVNGKDGQDGAVGATGPAGPSPEMRCENGVISWKTSSEVYWHPLGRVLACSMPMSVGE